MIPIDDTTKGSKMRTFAYCRVSTYEQTTSNQILEIKQRGYEIEDDCVVSETVSGGVEAMKRPHFSNMVNYSLKKGDRLIVLKLDRLGRDNIDVQTTIKMLTEKGVQVVSLDLPVTDLQSDTGKLMLQLIASFAEFEKSRIKERTQEGLARAKAEGKKLGRPEAIETTKTVQECKAQGHSQSKTAELTGLSIATVKRHWKSK